jgi:hypothetical protein
MANTGTYGTGIPVRVSPDMVDIFYSYTESRDKSNSNSIPFKKLNSNILEEATHETYAGSIDNVLEGMYNLKLPLQSFGQKGFYTVYIKPKEIPAVIADVSTLSSQSSVRGIVLDTGSLPEEIQTNALTNNGLVGYRIIYMDNSGKRMNIYRLVTSNNKCEPVVQTTNNTSTNGYSYRFNESSTLTFLTLTPSTAPSYKANAAPYIGKVGQSILLVNTAFEPIMLDIEITEHDADTISLMLEGTQVRDLERGIVTTYDENGGIYHQSEHYTLKENGTPVYEVKKNRDDSIDFTQTLEDKLV